MAVNRRGTDALLRPTTSGNKYTRPHVFEGMNSPRRRLLPLLILASASILSAGTKPNFSGTWKLNVAQSDLGGAPIEALVVEVEHKEPIFKYVAKGSANGQPFQEQELLTTDGKPGQDSHGANVTTKWDGEALVTRASSGDGSPLYESRISLAADRKTITRVFVLKTADGSQTRREIYERQKTAGEI